MRIDAPQEIFAIDFASADGPYTLAYQPIDQWDGELSGVIKGVSIHIDVVSVEQEADGGRVLMGGTAGFAKLYNDEFWAELRIDCSPATITYYGDRVLWRCDLAF